MAIARYIELDCASEAAGGVAAIDAAQRAARGKPCGIKNVVYRVSVSPETHGTRSIQDEITLKVDQYIKPCPTCQLRPTVNTIRFTEIEEDDIRGRQVIQVS